MPVHRLNSAAESIVSLTRAAGRAWLLCLLMLPAAAFAEQMHIRSAFVEPSTGVLMLNAQVEFNLPPGAQQAITDGVELTIEFDIQITRSRRFWSDETVADLQQRYELLYHAVSGRYLLRNLNSGEQASYPTLEAALQPLHRIERLPVIDEALV